MENSLPTPHLSWQTGSAYDLFISLYVLHHPDRFGVRPSWAAGVRSRLSLAERETLENGQGFLTVPLLWLVELGEDHSAGAALQALEETPRDERLAVLSRTFEPGLEFTTATRRMQQKGSYTDEDVRIVASELNRRAVPPRPQAAVELCKAWSRAAAFGEEYLQALKAYYQVFFTEEERRILPALESGLAEARQLAQNLPLLELLEHLSNGVKSEYWETSSEIILAPSFWSSPLVFQTRLADNKSLLVFGSRPTAQTIVPGGALPETLVDALKALADPTRLRILRHLSKQPLTPSELARRLRLRPPTVIHHLNALRLAGLVTIIVQADGERRYNLRRDVLQDHLQELQSFIDQPRN